MTGRRESDSVEDQVKFIKSHVGKMSWGARIAAGGVITSLLGTMYGGFLMYQKVEAVLDLDTDAFVVRMDQIDQKLTSVDENLYAIKSDLKSDIRRIEGIADSVERDAKEMMRDVTNDLRGFRKDVQEVEDRLNDKLQKALDNPLAD